MKLYLKCSTCGEKYEIANRDITNDDIWLTSLLVTNRADYSKIHLLNQWLAKHSYCDRYNRHNIELVNEM